ncbi:glycosyltransferase family 1 protein [Sphingobacterium sp.]|uniref:glycosyltransferase family 4 protein n=1 Tax=Sphingobacterium sp. TaxID=341027 RepID=UPI0028AD7D38|nr:glycosyltransferase family 1 protein [Sphingobacterium sp.]
MMIPEQPANVCFDVERLKYRNVGLFHFCLQLGNALIDIADSDSTLKLYFYAPQNSQILKGTPNYINSKPIHKYIQSFKVDLNVWHASNQMTDYLPRNNKVAKVLTIHDLNFLREKPKDKQKKYLSKVQSNVDQSDEIVCISEYVKQEVMEFIDVRNKPCSVIYNGNNINPAVSPTAINFPLLDLSVPYLFFVGAILPKKNIESLVYLLVKNEFNLVIAGEIFDKNYQKKIFELGKELGVMHRIYFIGAISEGEKVYLLKNCRYFCFPSKTEGFGLPVVEAMSFGKDIILSNSTSLPEIGGNVVRYLESFDKDYLIEYGKELCSFQFSMEMELAVVERSKMFSWEKAAGAYWKIYKELA